MKKILLTAVFIVITAMSCTSTSSTEPVLTDSIPVIDTMTIVVDSVKTVDSTTVVIGTTGNTGGIKK